MSSDVPSSGGRLVTLDGRALPLRATRLQADCCAGLGRVSLEQVFHNPHAEPLRVTYQVPLPADGAVTGYRFRFGDEEVIGKVDTKQKAREQFEEAILDGRTAALLEEERSSLFTQEVGNVPPGADVIITITVDQKLIWIRDAARGHQPRSGVESGWEWRFPTVVGPRYLGAAGRVPDASKIVTTHTTDPLPARVELELTIRDASIVGAPDSPSHALAVDNRTVKFAAEDAALDRDVVVRWSVAQAAAGVTIDLARPPKGHARAHEAFALLTVVPPQGSAPALPRDLIVLLDTSGSMGGQPLDQAKRVTAALLDGLGDRDRIELIEFSMRPRKWKREPVFATAANKAEAQRWLASLQASGGTEMKAGLLAAMEGLRAEAQRQIVLVSDGYIGFEFEIVGAILSGLPAGSRVHTVGVGSAVNRSLTQPTARAGRGVEIVIGVDEDPERATQRLLAATEDPLLVDLTVEGDALVELAPARPHDLFAASPALLSARIKPDGGTLVVHARTPSGSWEQRIDVPAIAPGHGSLSVAALYAREAVEDLETRRAAGEIAGAMDALVERHGLEFQISTRLTSWVAVSEVRTVDPSAPTRSTTMPHALPHGTSVEGFGLRAVAAAPMPAQALGRARAYNMAAPAMAPAGPAGAPPPPPATGAGGHGGAPKKKEAIVARQRRRESPRDQEDGRAAPSPVPSRPRPAAPAEAKPAKGDAAKERVKSIAADDVDRMAEPLLESEAQEEISVVSVLNGKWTRVGDRWVFEFEAPASGLTWTLPSAVAVTLGDGSTHVLTLAAGSTAAGSIAPRATIRLVVQVPSALQSETPTAAEVGDLHIELHA